LDVQGNFVAESTICISGLVANDEQDGGEEIITKASGQLPEGCGGVYENYTHQSTGSSPLSDSSGPSFTGAARLTAYRLKCQGEWRDRGLEHKKLYFLQKNPFMLKQGRILKNISC
jgi:hypothetical protein